MAAQTNAYTKLVRALNGAQTVGKVVDVSNLQPDGSGLRTINVPKTTRGTKRWVGDFPLVSDNYPSYLLATQILGAEYAQLAQEFGQLYGAGRIERGRGGQQVGQAQRQQAPPARLGPIIEQFPLTATTPAAVPAAQIAVRSPGARAASPRARAASPKAPRTPRTPKAPKSPVVRQPAILPVPGFTQGQQGGQQAFVPPRIQQGAQFGQPRLGMGTAGFGQQGGQQGGQGQSGRAQSPRGGQQGGQGNLFGPGGAFGQGGVFNNGPGQSAQGGQQGGQGGRGGNSPRGGQGRQGGQQGGQQGNLFGPGGPFGQGGVFNNGQQGGQQGGQFGGQRR